MPRGQATQTRTSNVQTVDKSKPLANIELWSQQATEKLSYYPVMSSSDDTVQISVGNKQCKGRKKEVQTLWKSPLEQSLPNL